MRRVVLSLACASAVPGISSCERAESPSKGGPADATRMLAGVVSERAAEELGARIRASRIWNGYVEHNREEFEDRSGTVSDEFHLLPDSWKHVTRTERGAWELYAYFPTPRRWLRFRMGPPQDEESVRFSMGPNGPTTPATRDVERPSEP